MLVFRTNSPLATQRLGKQFAGLLNDNDVLCLSGDLGSGKTAFAQGVAQGLNVVEQVTSPTYTVMNIYHGTKIVFHFDLYRLKHSQELDDIGFGEYTNSGGIVLIEWPDNFIDFLPEEYVWVHIAPGNAENERLIKITMHGDRYSHLYEELSTVADTWR